METTPLSAAPPPYSSIPEPHAPYLQNQQAQYVQQNPQAQYVQQNQQAQYVQQNQPAQYQPQYGQPPQYQAAQYGQAPPYVPYAQAQQYQPYVQYDPAYVQQQPQCPHIPVAVMCDDQHHVCVEEDTTCARCGCIFSFIPLIGWISACVNMPAHPHSERRRLGVMACIIATSVFFINAIAMSIWQVSAQTALA